MEQIHIKATIHHNVETIWNAYTSAEDIKQWNHATPDWHCTQAINDLRVGGKFSHRMEAKNGSLGFDFEGTYTEIIPFQSIAYTMPDGRTVTVKFDGHRNLTDVSVTFDPENENPIDMQRNGWQAILTNFKNYVERTYGNTNL
ncbi:SRPBCC family protein [Sphingobacterium suaedae]|uniref:SRPBCC family protein n=1 Tax=Sphingobacterium suaedae TaxID=1686402 RepID=A0ABW5KFK2_9SPHI